MAPAAFGANCKFRVAVWPVFRVNGNVIPESVNPVPVMLTPLTITAAVPVDFRVTDCVEGTPTATLPKATLLALKVSVGLPVPPATCGLSLRAKVLFTPSALEVTVAVSAVVTAATVAVKPTVEALAGTVTEAGTVTAPLLLDKSTATPPLDAAPLSVTVQESVPDPLTVPLLQESADRVGFPVPPATCGLNLRT